MSSVNMLQPCGPGSSNRHVCEVHGRSTESYAVGVAVSAPACGGSMCSAATRCLQISFLALVGAKNLEVKYGENFEICGGRPTQDPNRGSTRHLFKSVQTSSPPAFQPSSPPAFQPSSLPALQPSILPAFQPSSLPPSAPALQPSGLPALLCSPPALPSPLAFQPFSSPALPAWLEGWRLEGWRASRLEGRRTGRLGGRRAGKAKAGELGGWRLRGWSLENSRLTG